MKEEIRSAVQKLLDFSINKKIRLISHYDTDGITSAAIFARALQRQRRNFTLTTVKNLEQPYIESLPVDEILVFLDLASNSLDYLKSKSCPVFIFDHHEIIQEIPQNVTIVNPTINNHEPLSGAAISYLAAREMSSQNLDLASLAVIGMVGDLHDKVISKTFSEILNDAQTTIKKGLMLYPSTRPLDKALEYSSSFFIPTVTGSAPGAIELLREASIPKTPNGYKCLYELTETEMSNLITATMLRCMNGKNKIEEMLGNIFLIKFFNKLEDARELSALINACSRMGYPQIALGFCMGNKSFKEEAEKIYIEYKQSLISALKYIQESEKITGKDYAIINARDRIKDTIIGTVTSIISHSPVYSEGTIIIGLAYNEDKIKVSARMVGKVGRNVRDVLNKAVVTIGGEVGGHPNAAGCLIPREKETYFIEELKKILEIELVKI
jgi:single-stranded-DNA-specific exonuclease